MEIVNQKETYQEQRETLNSDVDEEEAESAEVVVDVEHGALDVVDFSLLIFGTATLYDESLCSNHALSLVQEPTFFRRARHQEWRTETNEDGKEALEEEDVAPGVDPHRCDSPWWDASETR